MSDNDLICSGCGEYAGSHIDAVVGALKSNVTALSARVVDLEAERDRIEDHLQRRREKHRTDRVLILCADFRADISGAYPARAELIANLEELYTDALIRAEAAEAALSTAREDALREAAECAWRFVECCQSCAGAEPAILALIPQQEKPHE